MEEKSRRADAFHGCRDGVQLHAGILWLRPAPQRGSGRIGGRNEVAAWSASDPQLSAPIALAQYALRPSAANHAPPGCRRCTTERSRYTGRRSIIASFRATTVAVGDAPRALILPAITQVPGCGIAAVSNPCWLAAGDAVRKTALAARADRGNMSWHTAMAQRGWRAARRAGPRGRNVPTVYAEPAPRAVALPVTPPLPPASPWNRARSKPRPEAARWRAPGQAEADDGGDERSCHARAPSDSRRRRACGCDRGCASPRGVCNHR